MLFEPKDLNSFPPELRALLDAELAAGNAIVEIASCFPAPPAGAYAKLAKAVSTRARASGEGVSFYDRNNSSYAGEFADSKRFFFVLEPPRPAEPEPDMDAIRAELNARHAAACVALDTTPLPPTKRVRSRKVAASPKVAASDSLLSRFAASMVMDYEKWREGTGYALDLIGKADTAERAAIESLLLSRPPKDWRDIEALAALDTPRAREALLEASRSSDNALRIAVHGYAPHLLSKKRRIESLVEALRTAVVYEGLTQALLEVQDFHPPEVMEALLRGLTTRDGPTAASFAAMLLYLHGKAEGPLAMDQRDFVLRFNTNDMEERRAAASEFRERIGMG